MWVKERYRKDHTGCYVENRLHKGQHECRVRNHRRGDIIFGKDGGSGDDEELAVTVIRSE